MRTNARVTALLLLVTAAIGGCSVSRLDRLHRKGDRVESSLKAEQGRVVALPPSSADRAARLQHLTGLRQQLSAANVGLGATRFIPEDQRETAYDVVEEVYDTIEWNIPLGPGDMPRAMPAQFDGSTLRFDTPSPTAPRGIK